MWRWITHIPQGHTSWPSHLRDCQAEELMSHPSAGSAYPILSGEGSKTAQPFLAKQDHAHQPLWAPEIPGSPEALVTVWHSTSTCLGDTFFPPPFHTLNSASTSDSQKIQPIISYKCNLTRK